MAEPLSDRQRRVLGALAEKAATVPDTYPMTLRGLQTACNQKISRDPVTDYDEHAVQVTLDELKARGLVRFVYASHGARSTRYRHVLDEKLDLDEAQLALLTVLLLRGPQTVNELRTRTERAHRFEGNGEVEAVLEELARRPEPLVRHLPRQPGQKESRWMHLLGGHVTEVTDGPGAAVGPSAIDEPTTPTVVGSDPDRGAGLEERVAELEARVATLEALLDVRPQTQHEEPPPT